MISVLGKACARGSNAAAARQLDREAK